MTRTDKDGQGEKWLLYSRLIFMKKKNGLLLQIVGNMGRLLYLVSVVVIGTV